MSVTGSKMLWSKWILPFMDLDLDQPYGCSDFALEICRHMTNYELFFLAHFNFYHVVLNCVLSYWLIHFGTHRSILPTWLSCDFSSNYTTSKALPTNIAVLSMTPVQRVSLIICDKILGLYRIYFFQSGRSRILPDLEWQIWPEPEPEPDFQIDCNFN